MITSDVTSRFVTVQTFRSPLAAEAARILLEAEGIPVFLADVETINTLGVAIGHIKLQVPQDQAEAASDILDRQQPSKPAEVSEVDVCLSCGADLFPGRAECSACGWSYIGVGESGEKGDLPFSGIEGSEAARTGGAIETMASLRRPIILLMLVPEIIGAAILILAILGWVAVGLLSMVFR